MVQANKTVLDTFTEQTLPDLDVVVLGALELCAHTTLPTINMHEFSEPLVVGSVNAARTSRILFGDTTAVFADESNFHHVLAQHRTIDGAYVFSASGGKHAIEMAIALKEHNVPSYLITNNPGAPARMHVPDDMVRVYPKNREPYTYNTSTYLSMILGQTAESAEQIHNHITSVTAKEIPQFTDFDAFSILVPAKFREAIGMFATKFDELFGPHINGRIFTDEEVKHAKTVVQSGSECFLSFGVENNHYGLPKNRFALSLPEDAGYGAVIAVVYYVIGNIQKQKPSYFKQHIERYVNEASEIFGHRISVIVE